MRVVEEYSQYFVMTVEMAGSSVRVTHYVDGPSGLIVLYAQLVNSTETPRVLGDCLRLTASRGPLRFALGKDRELCLRCDLDPAWSDDALLGVEADVLRASMELCLAAPLRAAPRTEAPASVHIAEDVLRDRRLPAAPDSSELGQWLEASFGGCRAEREAMWSFAVEVEHEPRPFLAWTAGERLVLGHASSAVRATEGTILEEALAANYHLRFFKLCEDPKGARLFALEWPLSAMTEDVVSYFARRLPGYLGLALRRAPRYLRR